MQAALNLAVYGLGYIVFSIVVHGFGDIHVCIRTILRRTHWWYCSTATILKTNVHD